MKVLQIPSRSKPTIRDKERPAHWQTVFKALLLAESEGVTAEEFRLVHHIPNPSEVVSQLQKCGFSIQKVYLRSGPRLVNQEKTVLYILGSQ